MKLKTKVVCQSCGTPVEKEIFKGTEVNGALSDLYCRRCYMFGNFTDNAMTAEKMSEIVHQKMIELKFPRYLAQLLAEHVYTLKRWIPSKN